MNFLCDTRLTAKRFEGMPESVKHNALINNMAPLFATQVTGEPLSECASSPSIMIWLKVWKQPVFAIRLLDLQVGFEASPDEFRVNRY
jgi:hypothetical protein